MAPQFFSHYYDSYHMMGGGDWGWGLLMMLLWAAVLVLITILVVRGFSGNHIDGDKNTDAVSIAKERYAKGEITKKEFEQLKQDLT